jgi:hypothetical protein
MLALNLKGRVHMKKRLMRGLPPLSMGIVVLAYVMSQPRFATYKGTDVVTLVAGGACLAGGLILLAIPR